MKALLAALVLLFLTPRWAGAQDLKPSAVLESATIHAVAAVAIEASAQRQTPVVKPRRHCCNRNGALIGAAVGAVIGTFFAPIGCDQARGWSCAGTYVKYISVMGGIGATIGAFADKKPGGILPPPDPRIHWRLSEKTRGSTAGPDDILIPDPARTVL
jgi:hypothetical protein